jgi:hypothetical protein
MRKGVAVQTKTPGSDPESGEMSVHARGYHWAPQSLDVIAAPWLCTMRVIYLLVDVKEVVLQIARARCSRAGMCKVGKWFQSCKLVRDAQRMGSATIGSFYDSMRAYSSSSLKSPCQLLKLPALCETPPELIPLPPD